VLTAAKELKVEAEQRCRALSTLAPLRAGKKGPSGRMDYRASEHPVMCIGEVKVEATVRTLVMINRWSDGWMAGWIDR